MYFLLYIYTLLLNVKRCDVSACTNKTLILNLIFYIYFRIFHDTDYKKSGAIDNLLRFFFDNKGVYFQFISCSGSSFLHSITIKRLKPVIKATQIDKTLRNLTREGEHLIQIYKV